ncbi:hypothetical protein PMSM_03090 [Paenibacillus macquariensis subsp. macquariensis]|nr:hypothetical protein PMSM_03090 [Paenibacillus macquariensis subsp. macquariensis]
MHQMHNPMHNPMDHPMHHAITVHPVDPYVVEALKCHLGKNIMLETTRGAITGCVTEVKPDHVVLDARGRKCLVRICEIVWMMPE